MNHQALSERSIILSEHAVDIYNAYRLRQARSRSTALINAFRSKLSVARQFRGKNETGNLCPATLVVAQIFARNKHRAPIAGCLAQMTVYLHFIGVTTGEKRATFTRTHARRIHKIQTHARIFIASKAIKTDSSCKISF